MGQFLTVLMIETIKKILCSYLAEFGSQESRILTLRKENLVADLYMGDKEASGKQGFRFE